MTDVSRDTREENHRTAVGYSTAPESVILDIDALLVPISAQAPSGESLKYDAAYDIIKEARREESAELPQGVWERKLKKANWPEVVQLCTNALTRRTKDLQIAMWLTEALTHLHGFAGLAVGVTFLHRLCAGFWETLHPGIEDDDDLESRVFPFYWMNEKFSLQLKLIPLTDPRSGDHLPYCLADWERVNLLEGTAQDRSGAKEDGSARTRFLGSMTFTPFSFYRDMDRAIVEVRKGLENLSAFLDERCGRQSPGLTRFGDILADVHRLVENFLKQKRKETMTESPNDRDAMTATGQGDDDPLDRPPFLTIRNRSEAYRMLGEAADYLHIHEPHSPTPYLVKRAVAWGHMTLEDLLKELVNDESDLKQIFRLLGIEKMK